MENLLVFAVFVVSLIAVIKGADLLVDSAVWFTRVLGLPQVIVGATIVSAGTTLPETMISSLAAAGGNGSIVVGTSLGSILCNTGLILGLSIVARPAVVHDRDTFFKVGSMIGLIFLIMTLSLNGFVGRGDAVILLALLVAYILSNIWASKNGERPVRENSEKKDIIRNSVFFLGGLVLVVGGANYLLDSGVTIARMFGIPEAVIALTLFAVGSSLPELVTSVTAALRGHSGLVLGNILGANTLNIILVTGVSAAVRGFTVEPSMVWRESSVALVLMAVLVFPAFFTKRITKVQGIASFLVYAGYITFRVFS